MLTLRPATASDLPAINDIYNHYVLHSTATYQTIPSTMEERTAWFASHGPQHPILVADRGTGVSPVVGWASLSPFHPRQAFARTVENSIYIHPAHLRQGIGQTLLFELIRLARSLNHRSIIALIDSSQTPSLALHTKHGFTPAGHLHQVGQKFHRWLDVIYMELILTADGNPRASHTLAD